MKGSWVFTKGVKCSEGPSVLEKLRDFPNLRSRVASSSHLPLLSTGSSRRRLKEIKVPMTVRGYLCSLRPNPWRGRQKSGRLESQAVETLNIMNTEYSLLFILIIETFFFFSFQKESLAHLIWDLPLMPQPETQTGQSIHNN